MASEEDDIANYDVPDSEDLDGSDTECKPDPAARSSNETKDLVLKRKRETKNNNNMEEIKGGKSSSKKKKTVKPRVWSEDDEIAVLQGIINFSNSSQLSNDPSIGLCSFIKNSLPLDVSKAQIQEKLKRLKKTYRVNSGTNNLTFSDPHKERLFQLSKKAWDSEECADDDDDDILYHSFDVFCLNRGLSIKWLNEDEKAELEHLWYSHMKTFATFNRTLQDRLFEALHKSPPVIKFHHIKGH